MGRRNCRTRPRMPCWPSQQSTGGGEVGPLQPRRRREDACRCCRRPVRSCRPSPRGPDRRVTRPRWPPQRWRWAGGDPLRHPPGNCRNICRVTASSSSCCSSSNKDGMAPAMFQFQKTAATFKDTVPTIELQPTPPSLLLTTPSPSSPLGPSNRFRVWKEGEGSSRGASFYQVFIEEEMIARAEPRRFRRFAAMTEAVAISYPGFVSFMTFLSQYFRNSFCC